MTRMHFIDAENHWYETLGGHFIKKMASTVPGIWISSTRVTLRCISKQWKKLSLFCWGRTLKFPLMTILETCKHENFMHLNDVFGHSVPFASRKRDLFMIREPIYRKNIIYGTSFSTNVIVRLQNSPAIKHITYVYRQFDKPDILHKSRQIQQNHRQFIRWWKRHYINSPNK